MFSSRLLLTQLLAISLLTLCWATASGQEIGDLLPSDPELIAPQVPSEPVPEPVLPEQPPEPDLSAPSPEPPPPGDLLPGDILPDDTLPGDIPPGDIPPGDVSPTDPPPPEPPTWTYQWEHTNRPGTVSNVHQGVVSEDGSTWLRQHVVTNPRGQRTQTWERSMTEDGYTYSRSHVFAAPDGTVYRQHDMSYSGTDPYNYQWQKTKTFGDGRTMEMTRTRSWDGETGTMERTFMGPNGQTRDFQRPWTPEDFVPEADAGLPQEPPPPADPLPQPEMPPQDPVVTAPPPVPEAPESEGFLSKLNPFRNRPESRPSTMAQTRRSWGFTVGSRGRGHTKAPRHGLSDTGPGRPTSLPPLPVKAQAAKIKHVQKTNRGLGRMNGHSRASRAP